MTLGDHEAKRAGIGEPVRRKEDIRFVSGEGAFGDTWIANEQAYALMVRSPHAHAKILGANCEEALLKQGVLAVLTGADAAKDGMKLIPLRGGEPIAIRIGVVRLHSVCTNGPWRRVQ